MEKLNYQQKLNQYLKQKRELNNHLGLSFIDEYLLLMICEYELRADFPEETAEKFEII